MNRDELARLPIYGDEVEVPEDLIEAGDASCLLDLDGEHQLYLLMTLDELVPKARLFIERCHWSPGKLLWDAREVEAYLENVGPTLAQELYSTFPARMYQGAAAHLVADDPDDGPGTEREPNLAVEIGWPRPFCGSTISAELWRGRSGRFWEMEKCYTKAVCKKCAEVAADKRAWPEPRELAPLEEMGRGEALRFLLERAAIGIDADWQASALDRELGHRRLAVGLQALGVSITEITRAVKAGESR